MRRTIIACAAIVLVAGALAGCREEEQGRALIPDKGTYGGPPETALTKEQIEKLTDRAALQGETTAGGPAGGPATADTPPRAAPVPAQAQESPTPASEKALNERLLLQGN
jgi:hypothetical protein